MPRGAVQTAQQEIGRQRGVADQYNTRTSNLYNTLVPQLQNQESNPQGYKPEDLAAANTASAQSLGGSTAADMGENNLLAARTRNIGGFGAGGGESARASKRQLSQNALGVKMANADLKEQQRRQAQGDLENIYGSNLSATLSAMGLTPGTIGQWTNAADATTRGITGGINTVGNLLGTFRPRPKTATA